MANSWVVDKGLDVLLGQINEAAPNRSKASDGSIGDTAHQATTSDHNPQDTSDSSDGNDPDNQVDARDFTHDPAHRADMAKISESLRLSRDRRIQYVIFNRRIFYGRDRNGIPAFTWQPYYGTNPHTGHMHVSVNDLHNDETQPWQIGIDAMTPEELKSVVWHRDIDTGVRDISAGSALLRTYDTVTKLAEQVGKPASVTLTPEQLAQLADLVAARMPAPPTAEQIADVLAARMAQ